MRRLIRVLACVVATMSIVAPLAASADYPDRILRIVVPYPPGGGMDAVTRTIAARLTVTLGQPVVVDNRAGGAGMIGIQAMTNARPDGYTLMTHAMGFAVNPAVYKNFPTIQLAISNPSQLLAFRRFTLR